MKQKLSLIIFLLLTNTNIFAQSTPDFGFMPTLNIEKKIKPNTILNFFAYDINGSLQKPNTQTKQFRNKQFYSELALIQLFGKNQHWFGVLAYAFQRDFPFGTERLNEHRIFQEIGRVDQLGKGTLKNRLRLEERFIENRTLGNYPLSLRTRYLLSYKMPFGKAKKCYLMAFNDIFLATYPKSTPIFNENWAYGGIGFPLNKKMTLEPAILWQNFATSNASRGNQFLLETTLYIVL